MVLDDINLFFQFLGVWHEISSYYSESATGSCPRAEYTLGNGVVNVVNSQVVNQRLDTITGTAAVNSTDGSARLLVTLNLNGGGKLNSLVFISSI